MLESDRTGRLGRVGTVEQETVYHEHIIAEHVIITKVQLASPSLAIPRHSPTFPSCPMVSSFAMLVPTSD